MKKCFLLLISIYGLVTCNLAQQNLVPNYSFENLSGTPNNGFQDLELAMPWFQPNFASVDPGGSTDLFTPICNNSNYSTPNNFLNFQPPRTGTNFIGFSTFENAGSDSNRYREYVEVQLIDTLFSNRKYCFKFYLSYANILQASFLSNKVGCFFSNDSLLSYSSTRDFIDVNPQIVFDGIISDTMNWVEISGEFTANGGEQFATIGNFFAFHEMLVDTMPEGANGTIFPSYFFVDDVSVYELPDYFAGIDTTICPWDSIIIGPQNVRADVQYSWSPVEGLSNPNIANPLASPLVNTNYILTITDTCQWACNSILKDTINITVGGCLGVAEIENKIKSRLVPNPASTFCVYEAELETNQSGQIEIYDINGKLIETFGLKEGENRLEIALTSYQNGVYIFKIIVEEELIETMRLVITK